MLIRLINSSLTLALIGTLVSLFLLSGGYFLLKPSLPEINLVDEDALQIPLKVYSAD
jgi:membrane carboxypeptidase/penicillin-binding protein